MAQHPAPRKAPPLPRGKGEESVCTADNPPGIGTGPITTSKPANPGDCAPAASPDSQDESAVLVAGPEAQKRSGD